MDPRVGKWEKHGSVTAQTISTFSRFLQRGFSPPLTVMNMIEMSAEERQLCIPGYGPLDKACDYCIGMGV